MRLLLTALILSASIFSFGATNISKEDLSLFEKCLAEDSTNPTRLNLEVCNCLTRDVKSAPKEIQKLIRAYNPPGKQDAKAQAWGETHLAKCVDASMEHVTKK